MAKESNNGGTKAKQKKFNGFANSPIESGNTKFILIQKNMWDVVFIGP